MTQTAKDTDTEAQDFAVFITQLAKGRTNRDLTEQLQAVVAAVVDTRKAGSITLKIDIKPQANTEAYTVTDTVSTKVPNFDRSASIFFVNEDHQLVRDDPNQPSMFKETK